MIYDFFFYLALSLILIHEMDAVRQKEWRIFILLSKMKEETAYWVFTLLHIPLYLYLLWALTGGLAKPSKSNFIFGLDVFFVIHTLLHLLFLRHKNNRFTSFFSWLLIAGAGLAGGIHLLSYPG